MTEEEELEQMMADARAELTDIDDSTEEKEEIDDTKVEIDSEIVDEVDNEDDNIDEIIEESGETNPQDEDEIIDEEQASDFTPIEVEVNGYNVTINSQDEMMEYIRKGADTFNKQPETHVEEKLVIDQGKLSSDDLKLLVEAKNGSKEALAKLATLGNVDIMDIDEDTASGYKQEIQYNVPTEVDKVASQIMSDEVHATEFRQITNTLPKEFTQAISQDANMLSQFSQHIKSGLAQEVIPKAINASMTNGKSFLQNYAEIGKQTHDGKQVEKRAVSEKEQKLRNRANSSKGVNNSKATATTADDIHDMTDAEFAEYTADPSNFK